MQGRLLPKYLDRYQAHPKGYWKSEFTIASQLDLDSIEFILDYNNAEENPLLNLKGLEEIREAEIISGVKVRSICADYFMEAPIHSKDSIIVDKSLNILERLIKNVTATNIKNIIIPCVDQSKLNNNIDINNFVNNIKPIIKTLENENINICLETDLSPLPFANMLDTIGSNNIKVNYDIGNSAAKGYDSDEEFKAYGSKITDLHIKDRLLGGSSVLLGTGDANFIKISENMIKYNYQGLLIFQAFRDDEGIKIFKKQFNWFLKNINL